MCISHKEKGKLVQVANCKKYCLYSEFAASGEFLSEITFCVGFNFLQNSEGYMGLISFVCGLGSKGLSHALGSNLVKVCVIKV